MSAEPNQPQRVRRPIAERVRDNFEQSFPMPTVPLDRTGDARIEDLLDQLRHERDRRAAAKAARCSKN